MIRPLRQHHAQVFLALGFFLPVLFALGIVARKPFPTMDSLPDQLFANPQTFTTLEWKRTDLFLKSPVQVNLLRVNPSTASWAVEFSATKDDFIKPDLMVYWVAGHPPITGQLPAPAHLLGGFNSGPLPLPPEALTNAGVIALYSLADNELVDVSPSFQFRQATK
jgi:hypothetical protein